jgi:hypothetical protein
MASDMLAHQMSVVMRWKYQLS